MEFVIIITIAATLLCSLVAGFVFAFAVVVMPGIKILGDTDYLRAFRAIDGVIQRNQPILILVWVGSALAVVVAAVFGAIQLSGFDRNLLIAAAVLYILGVQLPTVLVNIPLNNSIQALDIDSAKEEDIREARAKFEPSWTLWNCIRTVLAVVTVALLLFLLARMH